MTPKYIPLELKNSPSDLQTLRNHLQTAIVLINPYWTTAQKTSVINEVTLWPTPTEPGAVVFTSGSTGNPKACWLPFRKLMANAEMSNQCLDFNARHAWWLSLPLFHVGGLGIVFRTHIAGAKLLISENIPQEATHISGVPTQLYRWLKSKKLPSQLQCLLLGGGAASLTLLETARDLPLRRTYGLTETASQVACDGTPLPGVKIKTAEGSIWVSSPSLFEGYLTPQGLQKPLDSDGYFQTPDLGNFENGKLTVTGRADRIFKSAGELINPSLTQQALLDFPGILEAEVIAQEDAEYGHVPLAYIRTENTFDTGALREHLQQTLPGLYRPREIRDWSLKTKSLKDSL